MQLYEPILAEPILAQALCSVITLSPWPGPRHHITMRAALYTSKRSQHRVLDRPGRGADRHMADPTGAFVDYPVRREMRVLTYQVLAA